MRAAKAVQKVVRHRYGWLLAVIPVILVGLFLLYQAGYLSGFTAPDSYIPLDVPVNPNATIDCNTIMGEIFAAAPSLQTLNYDTFKVTSTPQDVLQSYKTDLEAQGYLVYSYQGIPILGSVTVNGNPMWYGFLFKSIFGVFIIAVENAEGSCVLYTSGLLTKYVPVMEEITTYFNG